MTCLTTLPHQLQWMSAIPAYVHAFAMRRFLAASSLSVVVFAATFLLSFAIPTPQPTIQDEFSNLLMADTFASGRLANPTHPLWIHFETVHVLSAPTYVSKYPPLPGLLLAFGQTVFKAPWIAVWLTMSLFCGVLCWALQGFLPPIWALLGAVIAALRIGIVSYWTQSYWGGTHAALAGALVIGALPRLLLNPSWRPAAIYACGLALLANGRPYEGVVLGIITAPVVLLACRRRAAHSGWKPLLRQVLLPVVAVFAPTIIWMGYYNYRTTGDVLTPPYVLHESKYAVWSMFLFADPSRPRPHSSSGEFPAGYSSAGSRSRIARKL